MPLELRRDKNSIPRSRMCSWMAELMTVAERTEPCLWNVHSREASVAIGSTSACRGLATCLVGLLPLWLSPWHALKKYRMLTRTDMLRTNRPSRTRCWFWAQLSDPGQ